MMDSTQRTRPRTGGSPIGLVIFIILTVVFAVLSYWAFASYQSQSDAAKRADEGKKAAEAAQKKAQDAVAAFQKTTGVETGDALNDDIKNLLTAAKEEGFGSGVQETGKGALEAALTAVTQQKIALDSLNNSYASEVASRKSLEEAKKAGDGAYEKGLADKAAEIQALNKKLDDAKEASDAKIKQEVAAREALRDQYYADQDAWKVKETKYILHVGELQQKVRELSGEGAILEQSSGRITDVNLRTGMVTLDIGAKYGVRDGMRFVAFTKDPSGKTLKKGVVEVITVKDKVSAARIISEEKGLKVGRNDLVYNLAGPRKRLFVFAGTPKEFQMDVWTNYIRANGGDVTDEVRKGDQVADYLVVCTFDEQKDTKAQELIRDARDFGLKIVKESDLKSMMGLK